MKKSWDGVLHAAPARLHGKLMMVFTIVTDAVSASSLPSTVDIMPLPAVETEIPACDKMVPTIVPPPAPLMVAALPTCQ
jgi:hypothetical protein